MKKHWLFGALFGAAGLILGTAGALLAQSSNFDRWWTPEKDATVAAPMNHKVLFENDEVRVLEVSVPPGTREPMHVHRFPAVIYLQSSPHMVERTEDGQVNDMGVRPDGVARWLAIAQGHSLENTDPVKPLKAIRVELKKAR